MSNAIMLNGLGGVEGATIYEFTPTTPVKEFTIPNVSINNRSILAFGTSEVEAGQPRSRQTFISGANLYLASGNGVGVRVINERGEEDWWGDSWCSAENTADGVRFHTNSTSANLWFDEGIHYVAFFVSLI